MTQSSSAVRAALGRRAAQQNKVMDDACARRDVADVASTPCPAGWQVVAARGAVLYGATAGAGGTNGGRAVPAHRLELAICGCFVCEPGSRQLTGGDFLSSTMNVFDTALLCAPSCCA